MLTFSWIEPITLWLILALLIKTATFKDDHHPLQQQACSATAAYSKIYFKNYLIFHHLVLNFQMLKFAQLEMLVVLLSF